MKKYVLVISFAILLTNAFGQVQSMADTTSFKKALVEVSKTTNTLQSKFTQKKVLRVMKNPIVSEGNIAFQKPNSLRWSYMHPFSYTIILEGGQISIDDSGKSSHYDISANKVFEDINKLIISAVEGTILDDPKFSKTYLETPGSYLVELVPSDAFMQDYISQMNIEFTKSDLLVNSIQIMESQGNSTLIEFSDTRVNERLPEDTFEID